MYGKDVTPDDLYANAVSDDADRAAGPDAESDVSESNSSNYGGSAVADEPTKDRVLHDD